MLVYSGCLWQLALHLKVPLELRAHQAFAFSSFHHVHGPLLSDSNKAFMTRSELSCALIIPQRSLGQARAVWVETPEAFTESHSPYLWSLASAVLRLGLSGLLAFSADAPGQCIVSVTSSCLEEQHSTPAFTVRPSGGLGPHPGAIYRAHRGRYQRQLRESRSCSEMLSIPRL